jgi:hypothetical protein
MSVVEEEKKGEPVDYVEENEEEEDYFERISKYDQEVWTMQGIEEAL